MFEVDLAIIGGGPAGMAAALEAYKRGIKSITIIERDKELGGILQQCIHNGFGVHIFGEELTGPEYASRFIKEVEASGIKVRLGTMVLQVSEEKIITAVSQEEGLVNIKAKAVILCMGARERTRGSINIPGTRPAGIYTAGTAQRFVNMEGYLPGRKAVILGSGDIGLIMARRMSLEGAEVKMVCEVLPYSGGLKRNIVQCLDDFNIPLKLSHTVVEIHGQERLQGVTIAKVDENRLPIAGTEEYVQCDTLLLSVGLIPENELSRSVNLKIDPMTSGPVVNEVMETSIQGIFACGNVVHIHDLVDFVTEESRLAAKGVADYILGHSPSRDIVMRVKAGSGIRYIVPQQISKDTDFEELKLMFRVTKECRNVSIAVSNSEGVIFRVKKPKVAPGEMESLKLSKDLTEVVKKSSEITVQLYES